MIMFFIFIFFRKDNGHNFTGTTMRPLGKRNSGNRVLKYYTTIYAVLGAEFIMYRHRVLSLSYVSRCLLLLFLLGFVT